MLIKYIQSIQYIYIKVSLDYLPKKNRFEKKRRRKGERDKMFFSLSGIRGNKNNIFSLEFRLNPFPHPSTPLVLRNQRLTGSYPHGGARGDSQERKRIEKEEGRNEVKILFFPYRTALSVFRREAVPKPRRELYRFPLARFTSLRALFPSPSSCVREREREEGGGKRKGTAALAFLLPPFLVRGFR